MRLLIAMSVLLIPCAAQAGSPVAGRYRCWSYNVSGGGGSCRMAPPLVLHQDGTYEMSSERGTYAVEGDRVALSKSTIRGAGRLQNGNQIVFEYDYRGRRHTVTYLCQECASPSEPSSPKPDKPEPRH